MGKEEREREGSILSANSFPKWPQPSWLGQAETGSQKLLQVSHVGGGAQVLGSAPALFPGTPAGSGVGSRAAETETDIHMGCWHCRVTA